MYKIKIFFCFVFVTLFSVMMGQDSVDQTLMGIVDTLQSEQNSLQSDISELEVEISALKKASSNQVYTQALLVILGAVSSFLGAYLLFKQERKKERENKRLENTMDLYAEFHSKEFLNARIDADKTLSEFFDNEETDRNITTIKDRTSQKEFRDISYVIHYFERLGAAMDNKQIDFLLLSDLFSRYIKYWSENYFNDAFLDKEACGEWKGLAIRIEKMTKRVLNNK